jgi:hypothetical protein
MAGIGYEILEVSGGIETKGLTGWLRRTIARRNRNKGEINFTPEFEGL